VFWKIVPTVTLNDLKHRWHFQRSAVAARLASRFRET
jgi:hypothetical protein